METPNISEKVWIVKIKKLRFINYLSSGELLTSVFRPQQEYGTLSFLRGFQSFKFNYKCSESKIWNLFGFNTRTSKFLKSKVTDLCMNET